jgi:hypothetical protein
MHRSHSVKDVPEVNRARRSLSWMDRGLQLLCKELSHCRECDEPVSPFEKVCPRCGVSSPVVVSVKSFVLPVALGVAALIALVLVW